MFSGGHGITYWTGDGVVSYGGFREVVVGLKAPGEEVVREVVSPTKGKGGDRVRRREIHTFGRRSPANWLEGIRVRRRTPSYCLDCSKGEESTEEYFRERRIQEIEDGEKRELTAELLALYTPVFPIKVLTKVPMTSPSGIFSATLTHTAQF